MDRLLITLAYTNAVNRIMGSNFRLRNLLAPTISMDQEVAWTFRTTTSGT
jgi:hypothetical protein